MHAGPTLVLCFEIIVLIDSGWSSACTRVDIVTAVMVSSLDINALELLQLIFVYLN